jgi:hypothetical protein
VGKGALGAVPTISSDSVGTPPDAFAPGRFAHPTAFTAEDETCRNQPSLDSFGTPG